MSFVSFTGLFARFLFLGFRFQLILCAFEDCLVARRIVGKSDRKWVADLWVRNRKKKEVNYAFIY